MCCFNKSVFGGCCCCCGSDNDYSEWKEGKEPDYFKLSMDLKQAMKGLGTDEKKIIAIIGALSYIECQRLVDSYRNNVKRDLLKDIEDETSGNFRSALKALLSERSNFDAELLKHAIRGVGTDDDCLIELICTRNPLELQWMFKEFEKSGYGRKDALTEISEDTSGSYKKLLRQIIQSDRTKMPDKDKIDELIARDVEALYSAGEGKIGTDDNVFIRIIGGNSREYCEKLSEAYCKKYGKMLEAVVDSETSFNFKKALLALVTPLDEWYADRLQGAMKGVGTYDQELIRIVAAQKDRRLKSIAKAFLHKNKSTLRTWVHDDTSGDYRKLLELTILNFGEDKEIKYEMKNPEQSKAPEQSRPADPFRPHYS